MKKIIYILIIVLLTLSILTFLFTNKNMGAALITQPINKLSSCQITAKKIINDNPDIDLSKYKPIKIILPNINNYELQIGKDLYTKKEIKTLK